MLLFREYEMEDDMVEWIEYAAEKFAGRNDVGRKGSSPRVSWIVAD